MLKMFDTHKQLNNWVLPSIIHPINDLLSKIQYKTTEKFKDHKFINDISNFWRKQWKFSSKSFHIIFRPSYFFSLCLNSFYVFTSIVSLCVRTIKFTKKSCYNFTNNEMNWKFSLSLLFFHFFFSRSLWTFEQNVS